MKIKYCLPFICCVLLVSCTSRSVKEEHIEIKKYQYEFKGIPIHKKIDFFYDNGGIAQEFYLLSDSSLDGFWQTTSLVGNRKRTQLFINNKLDTTWYTESNGEQFYLMWNNLDSVPFDYESIDTLKFKSYLKKRVKEARINNTLGNFNYDLDSLFGIPVFRSYSTGSREIVMVNENNLDGMWFDYVGDNRDQVNFYINSKLDTSIKLEWETGNFMSTEVDSATGDEWGYKMLESDSIRIVKSMKDKFN